MFQKTMVEPYKIFVEAVSTRAGKCARSIPRVRARPGGFHAREEMRCLTLAIGGSQSGFHLRQQNRDSVRTSLRTWARRTNRETLVSVLTPW